MRCAIANARDDTDIASIIRDKHRLVSSKPQLNCNQALYVVCYLLMRFPLLFSGASISRVSEGQRSPVIVTPMTIVDCLSTPPHYRMQYNLLHYFGISVRGPPVFRFRVVLSMKGTVSRIGVINEVSCPSRLVLSLRCPVLPGGCYH